MKNIPIHGQPPYKLALKISPIEELNAHEARHAAGQMAMQNPRAAHAMSIFMQLDPRGQDAMINCGVFHLRYPKEKA